MSRRAKLVTAGAVVVLLVVVAAVVGPRLYADWGNSRADAAPTLDASVAGSPVEVTDGTWTVTDGSFAGYRLDEVLRGEDVTVTHFDVDEDGDFAAGQADAAAEDRFEE